MKGPWVGRGQALPYTAAHKKRPFSIAGARRPVGARPRERMASSVGWGLGGVSSYNTTSSTLVSLETMACVRLRFSGSRLTVKKREVLSLAS